MHLYKNTKALRQQRITCSYYSTYKKRSVRIHFDTYCCCCLWRIFFFFVLSSFGCNATVYIISYRNDKCVYCILFFYADQNDKRNTFCRVTLFKRIFTTPKVSLFIYGAHSRVHIVHLSDDEANMNYCRLECRNNLEVGSYVHTKLDFFHNIYWQL